jgi:uncharacterized YigZ family protein
LTDKILSNISTHEELIKKSLFVGVCAHINTTADFFQFIAKHQDPNATHNCWAYRIGDEYRFNDDGEPSGTAGKPILAAIDGAGFNYLGALVIRYYGGIKLGTGGLARAYGGTTAKNLQQASFTYHVPMQEIGIQLPFEFSQPLFNLTAEQQGHVINQDFNVKGMYCVVSVPKKSLKRFKSSLQNISKGQVSFSTL